MPTSTCHPFLHQNKPSRESFFCGKVNDWWTKRALNMLNFTPKTRQNRLGCVHAQRQWKRKAGRLTTASTSGCRACSAQPTATAGVRTKPLRGQEVLGNCTRVGHFCQYGEVSHQKRHQDFTVKNIRRCAWRAGFSGWNMLKNHVYHRQGLSTSVAPFHFCTPDRYKNWLRMVTPLRDKHKYLLPILWHAHRQSIEMKREETPCRQCQTEIHKEVMYGTMALHGFCKLVIYQHKKQNNS